MTTIISFADVPYPRHPKQLIRNERVPPAQVGMGIINGYNHALAHMQKSYAAYSVDFNNLPTTQAGSNSIWRGYLKAGQGATNTCEVRFRTLVAPAGNASATDPYCYWKLTHETSGGGPTNTTEIHYGPYKASWGPNDLHESIVTAVIQNTHEYSYELVCTDYVQPVSAAVYGWHPFIYDDTQKIVGDPQKCATGMPITYATANELRAIGDSLFNENAAHLLNWACDADPDVAGAVCPTISSTTMGNIWDSSKSSFSSGDPGIRFQVQHHQPAHEATDVEITIFAYAKDAGDGGGGGTGKVLLYDSGGKIAETTGHSSTGDWQTTTGVLDGSNDTHEVQIFMVSDGSSNQFDVYAVSVYVYVASGGLVLVLS